MKEANPLEIRDLAVRFRKPLFENVNLDIKSGTFVTIMGENGAGKSVLIDCLTNTIAPSSGQVRFWGQANEGKNRAVINSRVGWVHSQQESFAPWIHVEDILDMAAAVFPTWNQDLGRSLLEGFQLDPKKRFGHLSLGEHSKLRLLKAISHEPELLVLDELTANLSPKSKDAVIETLIDLFSRKKMAVLYVCHSDEEALRLSDEIHVLESDGLKRKS